MKILFSYTAAALCLIAFFSSGCENDKKKIEEWTKDVVMREEATGVEGFLSQEGKARARLTAPLMYRLSKDTIITEFPKTLHVDFYNDSVQKKAGSIASMENITKA